MTASHARSQLRQCPGYGATGRDRTGHLHVTNVLLCQMSYSGSLKIYNDYFTMC